MPTGYSVGGEPNFVVAVDLNGDGLDDVVTVNADDDFSSGGAVAALLNHPCPGDIDGSGDTGYDDVLAVLSYWGPCSDCPEDLDGDGLVGMNDLLIVLALWGPCE